MEKRNKLIVAPSLLSGNFYDLKKDLRMLERNKIKWLHFDVMDGHFVNNISFGVPVLESLKPHHRLFNDVHIMVSEPLKWGPIFAQKGANLVTFHFEACTDNNEILQTIEAIRKNGAQVGMSVRPNTDIKVLFPFLPKIDLVLVMSVEPGFGGQGFMSSALDKIKLLREEIDHNNYTTLIEVDGGINGETGKLAREAGADVLVAGSYLLGKKDFKQRLASLTSLE